MIDKMKICFVCTGNTCRSPMAEGLFKKMLKENGLESVECFSAGISAIEGLPASENAVTAAKELGADISAHKSKRLSRQMTEEASLLVCMTAEHLRFLKNSFNAQNAVILKNGISDPYGGNLEAYRLCAAEIQSGLKELLKEL